MSHPTTNSHKLSSLLSFGGIRDVVYRVPKPSIKIGYAIDTREPIHGQPLITMCGGIYFYNFNIAIYGKSPPCSRSLEAGGAPSEVNSLELVHRLIGGLHACFWALVRCSKDPA